jgi:hypothetical protein
MAIRRPTYEQAGTVLLVAIAVIVIGVVGISVSIRAAADDLYASIDQDRGTPLQRPRIQPWIWLGAYLAPDVAPGDLRARNARADQLRYRSDRIEEAATVGAIVGLLVAVLSARPGTVKRQGRETSSPAAKTASNGTA